MRRLLLSLALTTMAACAPAAQAAVPKPAPKPVPKVIVGLSDQTPTPFGAPLFSALGMKEARYITPWDAVIKGETEKLDAWLTAARGAGIRQPLISFLHSTGDVCPAQPCYLPTEAEYARAFAAFRARYPELRVISPWNEANHKTQPTYREPLMAAVYWRIVKRLCKGCTIVAADVLDEGNMVRWLKKFRELAKSARLWGLHNYKDTNRFRTVGTKQMLKAVPGDIWMTETGAIVRFTTAKGVVALRESEPRAAKSMRFLFRKLVPSSKRIKRVYIYNWGSDPKNRFDAGLVRPDGSPRATYDIVKRAIAAK